MSFNTADTQANMFDTTFKQHRCSLHQCTLVLVYLCLNRKGTRPCTLQPWQGRSRSSQSWLIMGPMSTLSPRWDTHHVKPHCGDYRTHCTLHCKPLYYLLQFHLLTCLCSYISVSIFLSLYICVRDSLSSYVFVAVFVSAFLLLCVRVCVCGVCASFWDRRVSLHSTWLHKKTI